MESIIMNSKFIIYLIIAAHSICISFLYFLLLVTENNRLPASVSLLGLFIAFFGFMLLLISKLKTLQFKWLPVYFIFDIFVSIVNMSTLQLFNIKYINFLKLI